VHKVSMQLCTKYLCTIFLTECTTELDRVGKGLRFLVSSVEMRIGTAWSPGDLVLSRPHKLCREIHAVC
jgi:hypothetical protein